MKNKLNFDPGLKQDVLPSDYKDPLRMKRFCFFMISLLIFNCISADAQYRINKNKYHPYNYVYQPGDPYNPGTAAFASMLVPGLGQMISGEPGRGLGFMGRCALFLGLSFGGILVVGSSDERDPDFWQKQKLGSAMGLVGLGGATINWLWGIPDAARVAKVNNMAVRDLRKKQNTLSLRPYFEVPAFPETGQIVTGISFNITFCSGQTSR